MPARARSLATTRRETVTPAWRRSSREAQEILQRCPRTRHGFMARVKLFDYGQFDEQPLLVADFLDKCAELGVDAGLTQRPRCLAIRQGLGRRQQSTGQNQKTQMSKITEVAAAVLLRTGETGPEFFLAQRPPG